MDFVNNSAGFLLLCETAGSDDSLGTFHETSLDSVNRQNSGT